MIFHRSISLHLPGVLLRGRTWFTAGVPVAKHHITIVENPFKARTVSNVLSSLVSTSSFFSLLHPLQRCSYSSVARRFPRMADLRTSDHLTFGLTIAMSAFSLLAVILRLFAKSKTRLGFAGEDWLIVAAIGLLCAYAVILLRGKVTTLFAPETSCNKELTRFRHHRQWRDRCDRRALCHSEDDSAEGRFTTLCRSRG